MQFSIFEDDLTYIQGQISSLIPQLKNKKIFLTGANGFIGIWLMESLLFLNAKNNLNIETYALSRSKNKFFQNFPHLKEHHGLNIIEGTIKDYANNFSSLDYIIHGANLPYSDSSNWASKHLEYAFIGTQKVIETAKQYQVKSLLFLSSGAVYNNFITQHDNDYNEEDLIITNTNPQIYSMGKIVSEQLLKDFFENSSIPVSIARCFAFAGAHLPLENFALGNFIKNAILKEDIVINGTGEDKRSYLYGADLVVCLLYMLTKVSDFQIYNVGCDKSISIKNLAENIAKQYGLGIKILGQNTSGNAPASYIPDLKKVKNDFAIQSTIELPSAIEKMYEWNKEKV